MTLRHPVLFATLTTLFVLAPHVRAQDPRDDASVQLPPPNVALVEGAVTLDREDRSEPAMPNVPMVPGDRLRTERGRAEVLFPDGTALDVDEFTSVELQGPTLLRVTNGRVLLTVAGASNPSAAPLFQIDTPTASATTNGPGEYRVSAIADPAGAQTEMAILRGSGALTTERGTMPLRAGERSVAWDNAAPGYPQPFNSARFDAFDQWAAAQRSMRLGTTSAQYLPPDLRMYGGTFDRDGAWQYDPSYGYVWYPSVAAGWRPYYYGYWDPVPRYGWTWIGLDVWSWPTHHYGRWGHAHNGWFWIPDRHWATAWVSWGAAPGYVSWCPLGWDNRPVFGLSVNIGNRYDGWVVMPRGRFGGRDHYVHRYAVPPRAIPVNTPFVTQAYAPIPAGRGARRDGYAVPRYSNQPVTAAPGGARPSGIDRQRSSRGGQPAAGNASVRGGAVPRGGAAPPGGGAPGPFDARGQYDPRTAVRRPSSPSSSMPTVVLPPPRGTQPATVPYGGAPGQPVTTPDGGAARQPATIPPFMRRAPTAGGQPMTVPPPPAGSSGGNVAAPRSWGGGGVRAPQPVAPPPSAGPAAQPSTAPRGYSRGERSGGGSPSSPPPSSGGSSTSRSSGGSGSSGNSGQSSGGSGGGHHDAGSRRPPR
jgi:hypothetical protein